MRRPSLLLLSVGLTIALPFTLTTASRAQAARTAPAAPAGQARGPAAGAPAPTFDRQAYEIPHQRYVLNNGLTLLVHEDHTSPVVSVNLWYHVGSRNEAPGRTGFAHLFEHFFFNGSEHYPHGFREAMDDLGATNRNGTTSTDRTNFFEDVPVSALERTLYLEADRMGFLAAQINEAMLTRERGVVQNEKRQGENQPYGTVYSRMVSRMYPAAHPYSWPTIGSMADLDAATLPDIKAWYATYYGPNNCVLSIAGDITGERALALVRTYFEGIPPGPPTTSTRAWVPRLDGPLREVMEDRVPQARVYRAWHVPGWRDADVQPLELVAQVLSGSRSARLDRELVYRQELATAVNADMSADEIAGLFTITATVRDGIDPARVEAEIDRIVGDLLRQGPGEPELQRARSRVLSAFSRRAERLGGFGGRSDILAESATFGGDPTAYLANLERTARATAATVQRAGRRWLDAPAYTMVVTPVGGLRATQTAVDRTVVPPLAPQPDAPFPAVQRATLGNGLKVLLLERHGTPLVNMTLAVDAGFAADTPGREGTASLALDLLDDGTTTRDTFRVADDLDALGAQIVTGSSLDLSFVRLRTLRRTLAPSLDLFADVVLHPSFPADMVALAKSRRLAQIAQEQAQPVPAAQRVVPVLLYGAGHPYGAPLSGSGYQRSVTAITQADLVAWHRGWFHPNQSTLIVAGDVTLRVLLPQLERAFGGWARGTAPAKATAAPASVPAGTRAVYLIDRPGAQQSVIVAAHRSQPGGQPDDLAIETVMSNFGGLATSRLNRNLRLDKHWSYGTNGALVNARGERPFVVIAPVQTDRTKESIVEVQRELREIAGARPIRGEEFESIMRTQTLALPGRFATLAALENAGVQLVNYGYPDAWFSRYGAAVRALTEAELDAAARRYIRPDEVTWIIVGDLRQVEAGIRDLNLGTVVHIDGDGHPLDAPLSR